MGYVFGIILMVMGFLILFGVGGNIKGSGDTSGKGNTDIYFHE